MAGTFDSVLNDAKEYLRYMNCLIETNNKDDYYKQFADKNLSTMKIAGNITKIDDLQYNSFISSVKNTNNFFLKEVIESYEKVITKTSDSDEKYQNLTMKDGYYIKINKPGGGMYELGDPAAKRYVCGPNEFSHMYKIDMDFKGFDKQNLIQDFLNKEKKYNDNEAAEIATRNNIAVSKSMVGTVLDKLIPKSTIEDEKAYSILLYDVLKSNKLIFTSSPEISSRTEKDLPPNLIQYKVIALQSLKTIKLYAIAYIKLLLVLYDSKSDDSLEKLTTILNNMYVKSNPSEKIITIQSITDATNSITLTDSLLPFSPQNVNFDFIQASAVSQSEEEGEEVIGGDNSRGGFEVYQQQEQQEQQQQQGQQAQQSLLEVLQQTSQQLEQMSKAPKKKTTKL